MADNHCHGLVSLLIACQQTGCTRIEKVRSDILHLTKKRAKSGNQWQWN